GYLAYLVALEGTLGEGIKSITTPGGQTFHGFFLSVHPDRTDTMTDANGAIIAHIPLPREYNLYDFISICNHALACVLGLAGAIVAQMLDATRRDDASNPRSI